MDAGANGNGRLRPAGVRREVRSIRTRTHARRVAPANGAPGRQQGIVLPLLAVALVALLGVAALAIDLGYVWVSKTQLQNALDAAALGAAKVLDSTGGDTIAASSAATTDFRQNAQLAANSTLLNQLNAGNLVLTVQFSNTLDPFAAGTTPAQFVRVRGSALQLPGWFTQVVGINGMTVTGSAVAGPSPTLDNVCNVVPIMMCGSTSAGPPDWGYTPGTLYTIKLGANQTTDVGPGNYNLIQLGTNPGGNQVRQIAAGGYNVCMNTGSSTAIDTQPGNEAGPISQGLNTRLGIYQGGNVDATSYPPDLVTAYPLLYPAYQSAYAAEQYDRPTDGVAGRRVLVVPFGDCTQLTNGQGTLPLLGFGCFFMTDQVPQGGQSPITGQFVQGCDAHGMPGATPASGPGPHIIELYKDPNNVDA